MLEKKIYPQPLFEDKEQQDEKRQINFEIYNELKGKYKIFIYSPKYHVKKNKKRVNEDNYDVVIAKWYHNSQDDYMICKNAPSLTDDELALLCTKGNLEYGYRKMCINDIIVDKYKCRKD